MPYMSEAIANYFICLPDAADRDLTPMKLQKLVYFSHGWFLALRDRPLIDEEVQAWRYGPVIDRLYHALKEHGDTPVTEPIVRLKIRPGISTFDAIEEIRPTVDDLPSEKRIAMPILVRVWNQYGGLDAMELSRMTHEEDTPWGQIRKKYPNYLPMGMPIPNEMIKRYFKAELEKRRRQTKAT